MWISRIHGTIRKMEGIRMMNHSSPFYRALKEHQAAFPVSFHTPGHKCSPAALPQDLLSLDLTELPDTDSLYEADGIIRQAEERMKALYGTENTLFSAGGCTLCIQAMLRLAAGAGRRKVILSRTLHRSAVNTAVLLDLDPVWICPEQNAGARLSGRIMPDQVRAALSENPDAACVFLTSPDYHGVISPIREIADVCRQYAVPLLVDNAHGSHLAFLSEDLHPAHLGAAMTSDSMHKTLPVLTGGACLQIMDPAFSGEAKDAMALFGSTSPSYPVMASLDLCAAWLEADGRRAFGDLEKRVGQIRMEASSLGYTLPQGPCDPVRLTLLTAEMEADAREVARILRKKGIQSEHSDACSLILIPTPFNTEEDFERLLEALAAAAAEHTAVSFPVRSPFPQAPQREMPVREAYFAETESVPLERAAGRIAAEAACPCPPGIPVLMPGEKIREDAVQFLRDYGFYTVKVVK